MKHFLVAAAAAAVTAIITIALHHYGAHDIQGLLAAIAGYPGLLANGDYAVLNEPLFVAVNWLFYLLMGETILYLIRRRSA